MPIPTPFLIDAFSILNFHRGYCIHPSSSITPAGTKMYCHYNAIFVKFVPKN